MRDLNTTTVELSGGLVLTLSQSNWRIARKRDRLERQAREAPMSEPDDQMFAETFYPLIAAPVISDNCPTLEECLEDIPETDLDKWWQVAKEINPDWFTYINTIEQLMVEQLSEDKETKNLLLQSLPSEEQTPSESLTG